MADFSRAGRSPAPVDTEVAVRFPRAAAAPAAGADGCDAQPQIRQLNVRVQLPKRLLMASTSSLKKRKLSSKEPGRARAGVV